MLDLASIFAGLRVARERRGKGVGTALVRALLRQAGTRAGTTAYLQVEDANVSARRVCSKFGFRDGHACWYRRPAEGNT